MIVQLFIDESKERGYHFAIAGVRVSDVQKERALVRGLLLKGQSHLHFTKESDGRRRQILRDLTRESSARCTILTVPRGVKERQARKMCLEATVVLGEECGVTRLVFERDDSTLQEDRRVLYPLLHHSEVRYDFMAKREEPLLWIADAIAWCHTAGGQWKQLAAPLVDEVRPI